MDKERFEQAIRKAIADRNAQSPEQRLRIYDAARAALARRPAGSPVLSETLEAAIEQIESSFAPKSTPEAAAVAEAGLPGSVRRPAARPILTRSLPAFVGGAVLGAALAVLGFILLNQPAGQSADVRSKLEARYAKALGQLPAAEEFLGTITNAIVDMQKKNPAALEAKAGKTFIGLKALDESLAKQMPTTLPPGTAVVLRANAKDFKILLNWSLCPAASIARPELVDRVRSKPGTLACPYFGVWSQGAANW
jgi:hypothetical protein